MPSPSPTPVPTPSPARSRPLARRNLLLGLTAFCTLAAPLQAQQRPAPPNAEVRRTRQQLDRLELLLFRAGEAQQRASLLQRDLEGLAGPWQAAQDGAAPAHAALEALRGQALPTLAAHHGRWVQATSTVQTATAAHQAAVASLLAAPAAARAGAMARLDDTTTTRQAAEVAERAARAALAQALDAGLQALLQLRQRWQGLAEPSASTASALRQAADDWADLQRQWAGLPAAARAAGLPAMPMAALPAGAAPWPLPAPWAPAEPPDDGPLLLWRQADRRAQQAWLASWLQSDALAAVQQALADADCQGAGCASWRQDSATLQAGLARQQAALRSAQADQAGAAATVQGLPGVAQRQLQDLLERRDSLAPAVARAGGPALRQLRAAGATGQAALARLAAARDAAEAAWAAAWRRQYGEDAPLEFPASSAGLGMAAPSVTQSASASMAPSLTSHALHRLRARGDEPAGFGAYTYVLVGASVRPDTPGVHARLQRLLAEVRNLPVASTLEAELRARANSFVVPVPPDNRDNSPLVVDLALAQSLLTHLPPALRLADATRRLLYAENGPFLITLPGPLAAARADWPLLFADLSKTPEVVVADVVRRYMADLIGSFNPATTDWAPPAGMQVAIALVRLVKGSGDVVQAVFGAPGR